MYNKLKDLIRENMSELIFNNYAISPDKNKEIIEATSNSILTVIKEKVTAGNIKEILSAGQESAKSTLGSDMTKKLNENLVDLDIDQSAANQISSSLISNLLSQIMNTGKGGSAINIQDLVALVAGDQFDLSTMGEAIIKDKAGSLTSGLLNKAKGLFK